MDEKASPLPPRFILPYFPTMYPCPLRCINSLPPPRSVSRTAAQSSIEKRTPKVQSKRARRRTVDVGAVLVLAMPHPSAISVALPPPRPTQNGDHEATRIRADSPKPFRRLSGEETQRPSPLVPSVAL